MTENNVAAKNMEPGDLRQDDGGEEGHKNTRTSYRVSNLKFTNDQIFLITDMDAGTGDAVKSMMEL